MLLRCRDLWCCCYAVYTKGWSGGGMLTFLVLRTLYAATLQRSLVLLLCCVHEGMGWGGMLAFLVLRTLYVATLQRSLVLLLRCVHEGVGWGGRLTFLVLRTLYVATLQRSLVLLLRCVHEGVGCGGNVNVPCTWYVMCCYAADISGIVAALCTRRGRVGGAC